MSDWIAIGHACDEGISAVSHTIPMIERGAMSLADLAFIETSGPTAKRVEAAVWAYLWACENVRPIVGNLMGYPSLNELREALAARP